MEPTPNSQSGDRPDPAHTRQLPIPEFTEGDTAVYGSAGAGFGSDYQQHGYEQQGYEQQGYEQPVNRYVQDRPEPKRTQTTLILAIALVLVIAAIGVAAYIAIATSSRNDAATSIVVPNVIGESQAAATNRLVDDGFIVNVEFLTNDNAEPGIVFAQNPEPGTEHDSAKPVKIFVPADAETTAVPNVVDRQTQPAKSELEALGFIVTITEEASETVDAGRVIRQSIEAGQQANLGAEITIAVSTGADSIDVPNTINQTQPNAERILIDAGFVPRVELTEVQPDSGSIGKVISQNPAPNEQAIIGSEVIVTIGRSTATTETSAGSTTIASTTTTRATTTTAPPTTTVPPTTAVQTSSTQTVNLVEVSEEFVELWDAGDWEAMAQIADPEVVATAQEWYEPGGEGSGCTTIETLSCEMLYAPNPGETALIFEVTFSPDGFIESLVIAGDAG